MTLTMTAIRFFACRQCKQNVPARFAIAQHGNHYCPRCGNRLYYFGREAAELTEDATKIAVTPLVLEDILSNYQGVSHQGIGTVGPQTEILECQDILKFNPDDEKALSFLSNYYFSAKQFQKALPFLERLNALQPEDQNHLKKLATSYFHLDKMAEYVQILEAWVSRDDSNARLWFNLGMGYQHFNQIPKARAAFESAKSRTETPKFLADIETALAELPEAAE